MGTKTMFKAGFDSFGCNHGTASARCGLVVLNTWRRGNWWRVTPPAVPFASDKGADS